MSDDLARVQERVYALKLPEMEALAVWLSQVLEVRRTLDALRPPGADREASASAASSRGRSRTPSRAGKSGSLAEEAAEGLVPRPPSGPPPGWVGGGGQLVPPPPPPPNDRKLRPSVWEVGLGSANWAPVQVSSSV